VDGEDDLVAVALEFAGEAAFRGGPPGAVAASDEDEWVAGEGAGDGFPAVTAEADVDAGFDVDVEGEFAEAVLGEGEVDRGGVEGEGVGDYFGGEEAEFHAELGGEGLGVAEGFSGAGEGGVDDDDFEGL
jgi:hypothetical protein